MWIFSIFLIVVGISALLSNSNKLVKTKKSKLCVATGGILLFCISAFRHYSIGVDTFSYVNDFSHMKNNDFNYIFREGTKEHGYALLVKIISSFSDNYTVLLATIALIYTISICFYIYNYSKEPYLSFVILLSMGFFYFSMAGLRQTIAMAILIFSYRFIKERKIIPFLLLVLLAYQFHNTVIVFLIAYPIANLKINWRHIIAIICAYIVSAYFQSYIITFLFNVLKWNRISAYETYKSSINLSGFIIQICIMLFCLFYYERVIKEEPKDLLLYNLMFVGIIFQAFTPLIGEFFRISMYFSIFNIALIPNALMVAKDKKSKAIVYFGVLSLLLIYYYLFSGPDSSICPYRFS